ncbi:MAG: AMP-binding protein [Gemmatimonadota bacterium]|nr:AMP-binding protein [Gemmatimonadota bacterium]
MDVLTLRAAAGGGSIDGHDAAGLVAAGFTLLQRSAPLVRALAGKRSAILLPTSPQFLVALAASDGRGAVLVNPLAAPAEVAHQLGDANVGAVFTTTSLATRLPAGAAHVLLDDAPARARVVAPGGTREVDLGSHFGLSLEGDAGAPGRDEECAIVYTSAMAGTPLGAILTHRNLVANARQCAESAASTREDHVLAVLPFSHLFGLTVSAMAPLFSGARVTTMARFNPLAAVDLIERAGITVIVGVPAIFGAMLAAIERRGGRLARGPLRLCMSGGAVLAQELQERWADRTGVELRQGYGLTEASPVALFNDLRRPNRRGALGAALPGVRVSVRDPLLNTPLDDGTEGELCVAGETVFAGYVRGGEKGLQVHDGWLHTGDLAVRDADGVYTFRGLRKRMFTRNGFNVYPAELERVFRAIPGVHDVRVEGVADPVSEHEVHVTLHGDVTESDATAWGVERLAAYKRPTRLSVRPQD